ncbi:MAG TPA: hypothetical protein VOA80_07070, partial [Thermoanaerobaculia bacterium]|nr:hypothetical protein [Thermoanaerobaculia bacterium]
SAPWSSAARNPLVAITAAGLGVLAGQEDWIAIRGGIDLWLGGVHLHGRQPAWRWDPELGRLRPWQRSPPSPPSSPPAPGPSEGTGQP